MPAQGRVLAFRPCFGAGLVPHGSRRPPALHQRRRFAGSACGWSTGAGPVLDIAYDLEKLVDGRRLLAATIRSRAAVAELAPACACLRTAMVLLSDPAVPTEPPEREDAVHASRAQKAPDD
jgi:hypothetical protein